MSGTHWEKHREDSNAIEWTLKSDRNVWIWAERTNPAPRGIWQGWCVTGFDSKGTFFRIENMAFKKDAQTQIEIAKNKYERAQAKRLR